MFTRVLSMVLLLAFVGSTTYFAGCQQEKREDKVKVETPNKEVKIQEKKRE